MRLGCFIALDIILNEEVLLLLNPDGFEFNHLFHFLMKINYKR